MRLATLAFGCSIKLWRMLVALALVALVPWGVVEAQERDEPVEVLDAIQGNYHVSVRVLPSVPAVGPVNFTVIPTAFMGGEAIRDAEITLVAHDADGVPTYQARVLNSPSARQEYVGNIAFESAGVWSIHVEMTTEESGTEVFVARLSVAPAAVGSSPAGGVVMLFVLVALMLGGGFVWLSSRRALARRGTLWPTA